jgi:hypothetical protein
MPRRFLFPVWFMVFPTLTSQQSPESEIQRLQELSLASCELRALTVGSHIADRFNALLDTNSYDVRMRQEGVLDRLAFGPGVSGGASGVDSANRRNILMDKWIYMMGDSTTRQLFGTIGAPIHGSDFEKQAKEWTRQFCSRQQHRADHPVNGDFPLEGWQGACGINEVTCHIQGYGTRGKLSFDWKHFPFEDYDEYLFGPSGPFVSGFPNEGTRRPDILTVQLGLHTCWHAVPEGYNSQHLKQTNTSMIEAHLQSVATLLRTLRETVGRVAAQEGKSRMLVVVITSGSTGMGTRGLATDACIQQFNREATAVAHQFGFPVLDRGEIEHRLMVKSVYSKQPILGSDLHLPHPAPELVATSLLHLIECMERNGSYIASAGI